MGNSPATNYNSNSKYPRPSPNIPSGFPFPENQRDELRRLEKQTSLKRFGDDYTSLDQVQKALANAGLESSNLIIGIDFTRSNEWTGKRSFNGQSLHFLGISRNPYEKAISIIGRTLSEFDDDNLIPCFGFGDVTTHDQDVFSFYSDHRPCRGFAEVLGRYRELVPHVRLAGPTSFAPIIENAISIVDENGGQYHVLVIVADGQVTRSVETIDGHLSPQEQKTVDALVKASEYPLSIVLVGVGDGPWDTMHKCDDNIPSRAFDNFQFVNFTEIFMKYSNKSKMEAEFALAALMEIPSQYQATLALQLLGRRVGATSSARRPLPPPQLIMQRLNTFPMNRSSSSGSSRYDVGSSSRGRNSNVIDCLGCRRGNKKLVLGCGHQTCSECGSSLTLCPICGVIITTRIQLRE